MDLDSLDITTVQRKALEKKGANTVEELVRILPRKYYDFRTSYPLENIMDGETCAIIGTVKYISFNAAVSCVKLQMREKENFTYFEVKWFNQPYLYEKLQYLYEKERKEFKDWILTGHLKEQLSRKERITYHYRSKPNPNQHEFFEA